MLSLRHRDFVHARALVWACAATAILCASCAGQYLRHTLEQEGYEFLDDSAWVFRRYDVVADETTLAFMSRTDSFGLRVLILSTWPGRVPPEKGQVHLVFVGSDERLAQGNRFLAVDRGDCLKAQFAVDDKRLGPWPAVKRETGRFKSKDSDSTPSGRRVLGYGPASLFEEYFAFEVGTEDLRTIANAEIVLGRVCSIEFAWDERTLEELGLYAAQFPPLQ